MRSFLLGSLALTAAAASNSRLEFTHADGSVCIIERAGNAKELSSSCDFSLNGGALMGASIATNTANINTLAAAATAQSAENAALRVLIKGLRTELEALKKKQVTDTDLDALETAYEAADDALELKISAVKSQQASSSY